MSESDFSRALTTVIDCSAMRRNWLRFVFRVDQLRFAYFCAQHRQSLELRGTVSPNLRLMDFRAEPGAKLELESGVVTERQRGNKIWLQRDGRSRLGQTVWLSTEQGENRLRVFPGAQIEIGPRGLINGAMIQAKSRIQIGSDCLIGFGARVIDADLHDLDSEHRERIEPVRIGDRVWLGAGVMVLRGVSIGSDVVVGAGSIVTRDLPSQVLALGSPARPVRELASRVGCS